MVSIEELKKICYPKGSFESGQFDKKLIYRPLGLVFTKLCIPTPITPNFLTYSMIIMAIVAGYFFAFALPLYWLYGLVLIFLFMTIDCTDGQLARYRKVGCMRGWYIDLIHEAIAFPLILFMLGYGLFQQSGNIIYLYQGFVCTTFWLLADFTRHSFQRILFESKKPLGNIKFKSSIKQKLFYLTYGNFNSGVFYILLAGLIINNMPLILMIISTGLIIRWFVQVYLLQGYITW